MLIRDTVTAQERLSGLQPKCDRNELFNKNKMKLINKGRKNVPKKY
jgi:hypothetical protein